MVNPPPLPEPPPLIEAGITTSEWLALCAYGGQALAAVTALVVGRLGFNWPVDLLASVVGLEVALAYAVGKYILSRGLRKAGTAG